LGIKDKVSGFFSGIVDGVKNFLGIRSPSTVFEGIGGNMVLGIGEGFDKAMARVADDMQNAVPTDFNISPDISFNGRGESGGLASGPLVVVQQMIVRGEDDIRRISQELYNLMQTGSMAQGRFSCELREASNFVLSAPIPLHMLWRMKYSLFPKQECMRWRGLRETPIPSRCIS